VRSLALSKYCKGAALLGVALLFLSTDALICGLYLGSATIFVVGCLSLCLGFTRGIMFANQPDPSSANNLDEDALREKQELIESIAATSPTIFYIFDLATQVVVYANRELTTLLGYAPGEINKIGSDPLPHLIYPEDLDIIFNRYQSYSLLKDGEILEIEFRCLTSSGELRWMYARDVVFKRDLEGQPTQILVNMLDVTEKKLLDDQIENQVLEIQDTNLALEIQTNALEEANAQLESLAFTDGLTGIANHRSFQEELARSFDLARRKKTKLSLLLIDVDRFKQYNDTYGHPSGDIVLKRVAAVIREACPTGCLPARYGGEEFGVICPKFSPSEVLDLAEKIRSSIEQTPWPEHGVTVSIGAVSMSDDIQTPSDLVTVSDNALYSSKASGRNCVTFYDYGNRHRMAN
jgi:diguanylate cyclase (GGDEF)-like protein/PAS domain S-box-containing protein